jgi:hypothetical protein
VDLAGGLPSDDRLCAKEYAVTLEGILPVIVPIVLLQIVLIIFGIRDLVRPERRVRGGSKLVWGLIIVFFNLIGPALYFLAGREED